MSFIASVIVLIGIALVLIGGIMFIIAAFSESILWGALVLFIAPASLLFLFLHWKRAKSGFLTELLGCGVIIVGVMMGNTWLL